LKKVDCDYLFLRDAAIRLKLRLLPIGAVPCWSMARPALLTSEEIQAALVLLPAWNIVELNEHTELHRLFQLSSFPDAMHFMLTASRFIQVTDHHPRWQNSYSKGEVWITTGELQHRLSAKDVTLAQYLEDLFRQYQAPNS